MTFAFSVDIANMIRKLCFRYPESIDYLGNWIGELYRPGAKVDINIGADAVSLESPEYLDPDTFHKLRVNGVMHIMEVAAAIPPDTSYREVVVHSGNNKATIADKSIVIEEISKSVKGTTVTIHREDENQRKEHQRLRRMYKGSDLEMTINGTRTHNDGATAFTFEREGVRGTVQYGRRSEGGLHFYEDGRYISTDPHMKAVDIRLHEHNLSSTITKSRVIKNGRGRKEFQKIEAMLPDIVEEYLVSPQVDTLRERSEESYQSLLRTVFQSYEDHEGIKKTVKENIRFAGFGILVNDEYTVDHILAHPEIELPKKDEELFEALTGTRRIKPPQPKSRLGYGLAAAALIAGIGGSMILSDLNRDSEQEVASVGIVADAVQNPSIPPPDFTGSGRKPGMHYESRAALAEYLNAVFRRLPSLPEDQRGYVRHDTDNAVYLAGGKVEWDDAPPEDELQVNGIETPLPDDITRVVNEDSPLEKKLRAVRKYLRQFEYDSIPPAVGAQYPNQIAAVLGERKLICNSANTMGAIYLHQLGEEGVRAAFGARDGGAHMWLEINYGTKPDPDWRIYDLTPPGANKDLMRMISPQAIANLGGQMPQSLDDIYSMFDPNMYRSLTPELLLYGTIGSAASAGKLLLGLSALLTLGLGVTGAGRKISRTLRKRTTSAPELTATDPYEQQLLSVRDFLGLRQVSSYDGTEFSYDSDHHLHVPTHMLHETPIIDIIGHAVPHVARTPKEELKLYQRIARVSRG